MKKIFSLLSIAIILFSCSESGRRENTGVKFRAKEAWYSTNLATGNYIWYVDNIVKIIRVDSAYKAGDTMEIRVGLEPHTFILLEKVQ